MDYQPLSLSALCNADAGVLGKEGRLPAGRQTWHGLPFLVGKEDGQGSCVIAFSSGSREAVAIPVNANVNHIIFAHRLLESKLREGDNVGRVCADYIFCYAGGEKVCVPVRESFEIALITGGWGDWPMLAYPDVKDQLQPRHEGRWERIGWRQTEIVEAPARDFYLWAWTNPSPARTLETIRIEPKGPAFCIGAITLSGLAEFPFPRAAKREVKIVLPRKEDAEKPFKLEVDVDRGVATYPRALSQSPEKFVGDAFAGWGEGRNETSSPAYVEIAATPSATVTVKNDGETLGAVKWGELEEKRHATPTPRLEMILVDEGRNWVRTTVLDDETGRPVPCRIHFRSPDGIPYQPHGHHNHLLCGMHLDIGGDVRLGQITYAYINGACEGWLPRGEVVVDVARGFEYEPIRTKVSIKPGQQELTLRLKRLCNLAKERYFSGDTHVHFLTTQGAHTEAAGEGVNVLNLLQTQWGHLFTNTEEFTGQPSIAGDTIVFASQENRQHILGHLSLLGLRKPVMPWCTGGANESDLGGNLETTLCHWADACHAQGGTVIIPHFPFPNGEPAALIATGRADAAEMTGYGRYNHLEYYRYLNCGYKLPLVGGTDKMSADVPVGLYRTYVRIPADEPFSYETWCQHLRKGRTFLSGGPLLRLKVDGHEIGDTVKLAGNGGTVEVDASAISILPVHCLEIVMNGQVVARTEQSGGTKKLELRERIKVERHSWIAARCAGPGYDAVRHHDCWGRGLMAHTSPIYVAVGGEWWMFDTGAANYMLTLLHGGLEYLRTRAPQWPAGTVTHHHGRSDHQAYLEEPLQEAINAVRKRMGERR
jgi:hypothetical protein